LQKVKFMNSSINGRKPALVSIWIMILIALSGCHFQANQKSKKENTLHIVHAGSLTYPVKLITEAFQAEHPEVKFLTEAWGSKAGARRIMEIETPCDVYLSADYTVIENMLIPEHASWYLKFAANEMAIVYTEKSRYANEINQENWTEILLRPDVSIARSNPDHDPCGVRTIFTAKLAEIFYQNSGLADRLLDKNPQNIRPKETDLLALLASNHVDYIFLYRSVALQHNLSYLRLHPELSQSDANLEEWYNQVSAETLGTTPGSKITEIGKSMVYGLTIPHKSNNQELAELFLTFLLDSEKGMKIMEDLGQPSVVPSYTPYFDQLPEALKEFASRGSFKR